MSVLDAINGYIIIIIFNRRMSEVDWTVSMFRSFSPKFPWTKGQQGHNMHM